jgi:hypothetical protein
MEVKKMGLVFVDDEYVSKIREIVKSNSTEYPSIRNFVNKVVKEKIELENNK